MSRTRSKAQREPGRLENGALPLLLWRLLTFVACAASPTCLAAESWARRPRHELISDARVTRAQTRSPTPTDSASTHAAACTARPTIRGTIRLDCQTRYRAGS